MPANVVYFPFVAKQPTCVILPASTRSTKDVHICTHIFVEREGETIVIISPVVKPELQINNASFVMHEQGIIEARLVSMNGIRYITLLSKEDAMKLAEWIKKQSEQES
jgi:hypothetical protein